MNLYQIDQRLAALLEVDGDIIDTDSGEILSLEDVEALEMARADKIEGWGLWIKNKCAEATAIKVEEMNLKERRQKLEALIENSTKRYQQYLAGEKVSTPRLTVNYRKTQSVEVTDLNIIPADYKRVKLLTEPDKVAIKDAIKNGMEIPGAALVERQSMTIK